MKIAEIEIENLLKRLISIPSFSTQEEQTASLLVDFFEQKLIPSNRIYNNVWVQNKFFDSTKPLILLNSHHDTVKPIKSYTKNPFEPIIIGDKLYGLGSNDAGASLVTLLYCFLHFYDKKDLAFNLVFVASAEEENSGKLGVVQVLPLLGDVAFGIIGEPTGMQLAIAEKGLIVLDCFVDGKAGHAAREEGENAIYSAMAAIDWFRTYEFPKLSKVLGAVKMTVTEIKSGYQHNVIPDKCHFVVDIRSTDAYSNRAIFEQIQEHVTCTIQPRSLRLNASAVEEHHPFVQLAKELGLQTFGSSTMSDQTLMNFPTVKIGPGESERSHTADEFIYLSELNQAKIIYVDYLQKINQFLKKKALVIPD